MAQEGEASRLYQGQRNKEQQLLLPQHQPPEPELLPQDLADDDSLFTSVNGVSVHYKLMHPEVSPHPQVKASASSLHLKGTCSMRSSR